MIPLLYKLRKEVKIEKRGDSSVVISEIPLNVIRVSDRGAKVLRLCDGTRNPAQIAEEAGLPGEEQVFKICEYFHKKGMLEVGPANEIGELPTVTVIIPTKDRKTELAECLQSVLSQDYPQGRIEVIVIDDGSKDGTAEFLRQFPVKILSHRTSRGQSYCRNLGAKEAKGEILAFIDSDCVAEKAWLKELVPYFQWDRIGAVGGFVDGYFEKSALDRYENVCSSLNMGPQIMYGTNDNSTFYVPTCNLLVRREVYAATGGITERLHVGEDVDFCWRMRRKGYDLLYVPFGRIQHRHRNSLWRMMKRRADYGTSEAILYGLHREKKKTFHVPPFSAMTFILVCLAFLFFSPLPLMPGAVCFVSETVMKAIRIRKTALPIPMRKVLLAIGRSHFSFSYYISFHLVRYYTCLFLAAGILFHPLWLVYLFMLLLSSSVDYVLKKPRLIFPVFLFYYVVEHISYQIGVFGGCVSQRSFGSYAPRFMRRITG